MLATTSDLYQHAVARKAQGSETTPQPEDKPAFLQWRKMALRQYGINYRWSPLVYDVRGTLGLSEDEMKAHAYEGYPGEDVHAGDRAPDAPALIGADGTETTLFKIFKLYYHTLLVFAPEGLDVEAVIQVTQAYPEGLVRTVVLGRNGLPTAAAGANVYHDKEGHAHKGYHVAGDGLTLVVVRPDGYVGGFVHDVEGLQAYFSRVFKSA